MKKRSGKSQFLKLTASPSEAQGLFRRNTGESGFSTKCPFLIPKCCLKLFFYPPPLKVLSFLFPLFHPSELRRVSFFSTTDFVRLIPPDSGRAETGRNFLSRLFTVNIFDFDFLNNNVIFIIIEKSSSLKQLSMAGALVTSRFGDPIRKDRETCWVSSFCRSKQWKWSVSAGVFGWRVSLWPSGTAYLPAVAKNLEMKFV